MTEQPEPVICPVCGAETTKTLGVISTHPIGMDMNQILTCRGSRMNSYPVTVHLGILTGSRPIGARLRLVPDPTRDEIEGTLLNLTRSELSTIFYRVHLRLDDRPEPVVLELPLSHPVTLLTGREGRPEDGHTFRITVVSRGSSGIMGEGDEAPHDYQDSPEFGDMVLTADVRAWSQAEALKRASEMELRDWRLPSGVSLWHAREGDL